MPVKEKKLTGKQIARVLEKARKLMNNSGVHWTKGDYRCEIVDADDNPIGYAYCARGAIRESIEKTFPSIKMETEEIAKWAWEDYDDTEMTERERQILAPLQKAINRKSIESWNDTPKRTWKQVDEKFRKAAELARES